MTTSALITKLNAPIADNLGFSVLPSMSKCVSYHLLGVDLATSIINLTGGAPAQVGGSGPSAFGAAYAEMGFGGWLRNGVITDPYNRSVILVANRAAAPTQAGPPPTPWPPAAPAAAFGAGSVFATWNNGAQYIKTVGSTDQFFSGISYLTAPQGDSARVYFPDGSTRLGRFSLHGCTCDGVTPKFYSQTGNVVQVSTSATVAPSPLPAISGDYTSIGSINASASNYFTQQFAAVAVFTAFASDAEWHANAAVIAADVEARGIDFSPYPRDAAV